MRGVHGGERNTERQALNVYRMRLLAKCAGVIRRDNGTGYAQGMRLGEIHARSGFKPHRGIRITSSARAWGRTRSRPLCAISGR